MGFGGEVAMLLGLVVIMGGWLQVSRAAVYKVGGSAGWTIIGNVDYKQWAAPKTFHVGDIILFEYNAQFHDVIQVKHVDYQSCNASGAIATHKSGNDSITITNHGHHFFICGVPGHCQGGQKVDINVLRVSKSTAAPTPSVSSALAPAPPHKNTPTPAPAPNSSSAAPSLSYVSTTTFFVSLICKILLAMVVN